MRMLEKMVLINSANMKCDEVRLDGNVHFIGRNGVGKSTLLRAVLFLYNASTTGLGITENAGQKKFIDFYLPDIGSYLVYQVSTEAGPFMAVAYRSNERICFRFIDTAYDQSYFLDENKQAYADWSSIARSIGDKSLIYGPVRTFDEFRNIIYGREVLDKRMARFRLFNKGVGSSMPRIIQDVYLNNTLDADDIKKTIIGSMDSADGIIDLDKWRGQLAQLKNKITDVNLWCRKDKDGQVRVQTDAGKLVEALHKYRENLFSKNLNCKMLAYTLKREKQALPEMVGQMQVLAAEMERIQRLVSEEDKKYQKERDELVGKKKILENQLKVTDKKREEYRLQGIDNVLVRMADEGKWRDNKEILSKQFNILTDKSKDIRQKYEHMIQTAEEEYRREEIRVARQKLEVEKQCMKKEKELEVVGSRRKETIQNERNQVWNTYQAELDALKDNLAGIKVRMAEAINRNPGLQQVALLQTEIHEKEEKVAELVTRKASIDASMTKIRHEFEMKEKEIMFRLQTRVDALENMKKDIFKQMDEIGLLLDSWEGSFMNWLEDNVPGWEDTIGRTVLEENVLYNKSLSPLWVGDSQTLFGVKIDCSQLVKNIRTPKELQRERESFGQKLNEIDEQIFKERALSQKELDEERQALGTAINKLAKEKESVEQNYGGLTANIVNLKKRIGALKVEADEWLDARNRELKHEQETVERKMDSSGRKWNEFDTKVQKDLQALEQKIRKSVQSVQDDMTQTIKVLDEVLIDGKKRLDNRKKQLHNQLTEEMVKDGVDEDVLKKLQAEIDGTVKELEWIEGHREFCFRYNKDKEDYFDKEEIRKMEFNRMKKSLEQIEQKYTERMQKKIQDKERCRKEYETLDNRHARMQDKVNEVELYLCGSNRLDGYSPDDVAPTDDSLASVFSNLRHCIEDEVGLKDALKARVVRFRKHFSDENTFNFQTNPETDSEFLRLAGQVDEFLKGNVIETLKIEVQKLSLGLLGNLCRDYASLNERIAVVKKMVNRVNAEFRQNQFTDVINLVEMRVEESSNNRLMRQLNSLAEFFGTNRMFMENNLFADEKIVREVNERLIVKLSTFLEELNLNNHLKSLTLLQAFELTLRVTENGNASAWLNRLSGWGSEGTGIMVKAMINIVLLNIHRNKGAGDGAEEWVHCIMDEIGKIHSTYIKGLLEFANARRILLVNGSPEQHCIRYYRRTYMVQKDRRNVTRADLMLERII